MKVGYVKATIFTGGLHDFASDLHPTKESGRTEALSIFRKPIKSLEMT
jgi:hypothetical protein